MKILSFLCNAAGMRRVRDVHKRFVASTDRLSHTAEQVPNDELEPTLRRIVEAMQE